MNQIKFFVLLAVCVGLSQGLQCYTCLWMDMGSPDPANCQNDPANSTFTDPGPGQYNYCITIYAVHTDHRYGNRLASHDTQAREGCIKGFPVDFSDSSLTEVETCYCQTDACNKKPFSKDMPAAANSNFAFTFFPLLAIFASLKNLI